MKTNIAIAPNTQFSKEILMIQKEIYEGSLVFKR